MADACPHPDVARMDHTLGHYEDTRPMVNRMCRRCKTHWYGEAGVAVFEMPRAVWDRWMDSGLTYKHGEAAA